MNTTTRRQRLALLLGLIATGLETVDAAEWTSTIDRYETVPTSATLGGRLDTTAEALWIGPDRAFDPATGADLSPWALPERISLIEDQYGVSSRRGQIWGKYQFFDDLTYFQPDAVEGFWGISGYATSEAIYLAKDGAQKRRWKAADLAHPDMQVIAVNPLLEDTGALILIGNTTTALALQMDHRGQVVRSTSVPACSNAVADDRHGGVYAYCPSATTAGQLHHVGASGTEQWSAPVRHAFLRRSGISVDGGVLASEWTPDSAKKVLQSFDREGHVRFRVAADDGVVVDDGFWFNDGVHGILMRYSTNGQLLNGIAMPQLRALAAHRSGGVVAALGDEWQSPNSEYRFVSSSGLLLRTIPRNFHKAVMSSVLEVVPGSTVPTQRVASGDVLINDDGQPASAVIGHGPSLRETAMADARTVCKSGLYMHIVETPYTHCFNRATGRMLTDNIYGNGQLTWVDEQVVLDDGFVVMKPNGELIARISREGALAHDFHPTQGFAVLRVDNTSSSRKVLERYRKDGSLRFTTVVPFVAGEAVVGVGSDGSTVVAGKQSPSTLLHYDAEGNLRAMRTLEWSQSNIPLVAASPSAEGVLLLQRAGDDQTSYRGQLTVLDAQLVRRAVHPFSGAHAAVLQPVRAGTARFVQTLPSGLVVQRLDPATGLPGERRVLPVQDTAGRFAIDLDGVIRAMSFDPALGRDVLRISRPAPNTFSGPIGQTALSGSWYSPASTGQGLIIDLLNDGTQLFAAWHTYASEGGNELAKQQWLTVQGDVHEERGAIQLPIYRNSQGGFDLAGRTGAVAVGSAELVFTSCDRMEFWWRIGDDSGALPLQRLTPRTQPCNNGTQVEPAADAAPAIDLTGPWYDPSRSGQGLAVSTSGARFKQFFAGWFTYDVDGHRDDADAQHWFTVQGSTPARYGETVTASVFRTTGGSRAGAPTRNTHKVGSALLTVHDCAHATLEYVFDDSAVAAAFANRQRVVPLTRLGRCDD